MSTSSSGADSNKPASNDAYPEQRHAGKVGYGPNYNTGASFLDKVSGLTEELHGKIAHRPELVQEGHDKISGEAKRRKVLGLDDENSPFGTASDEPQTPGTPQSDTSQTEKPVVHALPGSKSSTNSGSSQNSSPLAREQGTPTVPQDTHSQTV